MIPLTLKIPVLVVATIAVILSVTRFCLSVFSVPEEQHLVAGIVVSLALQLLSSPLLALLIWY